MRHLVKSTSIYSDWQNTIKKFGDQDVSSFIVNRLRYTVLTVGCQPEALARDVKFAANLLHTLRHGLFDLVVRNGEGNAFRHGLLSHQRFEMRSECGGARIENR